VRTRSLACESEKHTSKVTTGVPEATGLPCAIGLTAYSALFPVIGLSCHRRGPRCEKHLGLLDVSVETSEPRGFAVCGWRSRPALFKENCA
jgi:hypothetical protein